MSQYSRLISHLLDLFVWVCKTAFCLHLLALVVALYIFFLVLVDTLHILNHLVVSWRDHVSVLVLHQIFVLPHALLFFAFDCARSFLLFE